MNGLRGSSTLLSETPTGRFLRYATVQILAVAVLVSFTAPLAIYFPDPPDVVGVLLVDSPATYAAGTGAAATAWTLKALEVAALVLYVAVPLAVAWNATHESDRRPRSAALWAGIALLGLPWFVAWRELLRSPAPTHRVLGGLLALGGPALVVVVGRVLARPAAHGDAGEPEAADAPTGPPPGVFLGFLLATSVLAVPLVVPNPTAGLVEGAGGPFADRSVDGVAFDYDYRATGEGRGVLTVTYAAGAALPVDAVTVGGTGLAAVQGANQTAPGEWQGAVTGTTVDGGPAVRQGDSVAVGVTGDCEVRIVDETSSPPQTIWKYGCPASGAGESDGQLGPATAGGGR